MLSFYAGKINQFLGDDMEAMLEQHDQEDVTRHRQKSVINVVAEVAVEDEAEIQSK